MNNPEHRRAKERDNTYFIEIALSTVLAKLPVSASVHLFLPISSLTFITQISQSGYSMAPGRMLSALTIDLRQLRWMRAFHKPMTPRNRPLLSRVFGVSRNQEVPNNLSPSVFATSNITSNPETCTRSSLQQRMDCRLA